MRVLIVGGTGLISTAITQQLLDRGDAVTVFNRGRMPVRVRGALELEALDHAEQAERADTCAHDRAGRAFEASRRGRGAVATGTQARRRDERAVLCDQGARPRAGAVELGRITIAVFQRPGRQPPGAPVLGMSGRD